jgi:hypothetical protein
MASEEIKSSITTRARSLKETMSEIYKIDLSDKVIREIEDILFKYRNVQVAYRPISTVEAFENKLFMSNDLTLGKRGNYDIRIEELLYLMNSDGIETSLDTYINFDDKQIVDSNWNTSKGDKKPADKNIAIVLTTYLENGKIPSIVLYMYILNTDLMVGPGSIIFEDIKEDDVKEA